MCVCAVWGGGLGVVRGVVGVGWCGRVRHAARRAPSAAKEGASAARGSDAYRPGRATAAAAAPGAVPAVEAAEPIVQVAAPVAEEFVADKILSPMVGTYYASPSPDSPVFVKEGDVVKKGQPLAILEAMKIMNELEAEFDCKILKILVEDGKPVEYDMPLFVVEKI